MKLKQDITGFVNELEKLRPIKELSVISYW